MYDDCKQHSLVHNVNVCDVQIAMRWRVEKEVVSGKGQFSCGNKRCDVGSGGGGGGADAAAAATAALRSWEVNFGYVEHGEKKNALVKLRE